ncbi:hypothetical protein SteCoe_32053 [Stentor coeruleus]|uniref:Uncharacterized protein n=1 Tax=Stentor coeruleus TaxID=5963 RepID=A0A1R2B005_9CILI|nr:hypothetical protein SteCoe_32053 [Stentor coeruleus]
MEFKSILDSVTKLRKNLQDKRKERSYSRSNSPKGMNASTLHEYSEEKTQIIYEHFKKPIGIPTNRNELIEKYSSWKCPLPRPKSRQKTYKLDAADLLIISIAKVLKKYFTELKQYSFKEQSLSRKPPIKKYTRGRSASESEKTEDLRPFAFKNDLNIKTTKKILKKDNHKAVIVLMTQCLNILVNRTIRLTFMMIQQYGHCGVYKVFFSKIHMVLDSRLKFVFRGVVRESQLRGELPKLSEICTPKFFKYNTPKANEILKFDKKPSTGLLGHFSKLPESRKFLSLTPKAELPITPGKIVKTSIIQACELEKSRISEVDESEHNPTFGLDTETSRLSIEEIKAQTSQRSIEIRRNLEELDHSSNFQSALLNRSKLITINSLNTSVRKSENVSAPNTASLAKSPSKSNIKTLIGYEISPIKLKSVNNSATTNAIEDTWNQSHIEMTENYEELSLKSFAQHGHFSSFDKDNSIVKNLLSENNDYSKNYGKMKSASYIKEDSESFTRDYNLLSLKSCKSKQNSDKPIYINKRPNNNSELAKRKRFIFISRLEVLSRLEEKFYNKVNIEYKRFLKALWIMSCEEIIEGVTKVIKMRMKEIWNELNINKPKKVYVKCIKNLCDIGRKSFCKMKILAMNRWSTAAKEKALRISKQKSALKSLTGLLHKKILIKLSPCFILLKPSYKPRALYTESLFFTIKNVESLISRLFRKRKSYGFTKILSFSIKTLQNPFKVLQPSISNLSPLLPCSRRHFKKSETRYEDSYLECNEPIFLLPGQELIIDKLKKLLYPKLLAIISRFLKTRLIKLCDAIIKIEKNVLGNYMMNWKNMKKQNKMPMPILSLTKFLEVLKKKAFPFLWHSWKCLKNVGSTTQKVFQKVLLRKYIEIWEKHVVRNSDKWIECFYSWRSQNKLEKMYKLKEYKQIFK